MQLTARDLGYQLPDGRWLFDGLSFDCAAGTITGLLGPSGSGKSTLISIVGGGRRPTQGTVERPEGATIDWIHQISHGTAGRRVIDHVALPLLAGGLDRDTADDQAGQILARFRMDSLGQQEYSSLSGGERQRLMLARSIAKSPDLILADEPTAALDARAALGVIEVLSELSRDGAIVIVATHDERVRSACDAIVCLG